MTERTLSLLHGVAGEYFVAAELSRQGFIASITLRNTRGIDILASNANASRTVGIQVKTHKGKRTGWLMGKRAETYSAPDLFYVFVRLPPDGGLPEYHIVPSRVVADAVRVGYAKWRATPGKRGQERNDSSMRMFNDWHLGVLRETAGTVGKPAQLDYYRNNWRLLGL